MIELPKFKGELVQTGNSQAFIVPAKTRADHGVQDKRKYWVTMILEPVEEGVSDEQ